MKEITYSFAAPRDEDDIQISSQRLRQVIIVSIVIDSLIIAGFYLIAG